MAKTIAVFGGTGQQGGAVVRALLKDEQYVVRAITRNPDGESGKALKAQDKCVEGLNLLFSRYYRP